MCHYTEIHPGSEWLAAQQGSTIDCIATEDLSSYQASGRTELLAQFDRMERNY
jgi:hypothetical protein